MYLPRTAEGSSAVELGVTFHSAATTLERLGQLALNAAADRSAGLLLRAADTLRRAADVLLDPASERPPRNAPALLEARAGILALAERIPTPSATYVSYGRESLQTYWQSLTRYISRTHRKGQRWPKRRRRDHARHPNRANRGPSIHEGAGLLSRRFLVQEVTSWPGYSGSIWAVGCTTREQAMRSLDWRVLRNLFDEGTPGDVLVFDRRTRRAIAWTTETAKSWYSSSGYASPISEAPEAE